MVLIGAALQHRLVDAAKRHIGPEGESILRTAANQAFALPLEQITYDQLPELFSNVDQVMLGSHGREAGAALARAMEGLWLEITSDISGRLVASVAKHVGPTAEPLLRRVCDSLNLALDTIDETDLPSLATRLVAETEGLLGRDVATTLGDAVLQANRVRPPGMVKQIVALATEHLGTNGPELVREVCRQSLELELDHLQLDGVELLARAVERAPELKTRVSPAATFLAAAQLVITSPADSLRQKLSDMAARSLGPAGPDYLRERCRRGGLPFEAVDYEHVMWLAELIRSEMTSLVGKKEADRLAGDVRKLITRTK